MQLDYDGAHVQVIGETVSYNTAALPIHVAGSLGNQLGLNSVRVYSVSGDINTECEIYEWGAIEIPYAAQAGLPTTTISEDTTLKSNSYAIVDTTAGPVTLTMPSVAQIGDDIIILDAARTFGQDGSECTVDPGDVLIEGADTAVDLNVQGNEYKFKFVGGNIGWRMI